jgi:large subunit ribosomal protein L24
MGASELALEDIDGDLAAGRLTGEVTFRRIADGVAAHGRLALADVDAAAILPGEGRAAVAGRLALQVEVDGSGLSPAALLGSLTGTGTATLTAGEIAGFDPKAFDVVIGAVDQGLAIDAAKVRDIVTAALDRGSLRVARADGAFSIAAGQARLSTSILRGEGADLSMTGHFDLAERLIDARLTFSGPAPEGSNAGRPDVHLAVRGPLGATQRTIDVTALSAWLTLRAVDREAKRIDAMEAAARDAAISPIIAPPQIAPGVAPTETAPPRRPAAPIRPEASAVPPRDPAPALPPPIDIRPAPTPSGSPARPKASGSATPNPAATRPSAPARPPPEVPPAAQERSIFDRLFGPQR